MRTIATILSGSTLYGTTTPDSDRDTKGVFLPDGRSLVLQRPVQSISTNVEKPRCVRNAPGQIDHEAFSLQKFFGLVAEGQTVAVEMLFTPRSAYVDAPSSEWREIIANRPRLLTRKTRAFVSFCQQQAVKYGLKGARLIAIQQAVALAEQAIAAGGPRMLVGAIESDIRALAAIADYIEVVDIPQATRNSLLHWKVCDRHLPFTVTLANALEILQAVERSYGKRSQVAANNKGQDCKALSHAMRVATQAYELLTTGEIRFPLANAPYLIAIKTGQIRHESVLEDIEITIAKIESEEYRSSLPETVDTAWIENFLADAYAGEVIRGFPHVRA